MELLNEILTVMWAQFIGPSALHTLSNAVHLAFVPVATIFGIDQICAAADAGIPAEYR